MKTQPISRRALAAGLALAPVAGLPAFAGAVSVDDPVFAALEKLKELKLAAVEPSDAHTVAEEVYLAARKGIFVDGKELRTHGQIDSHFSSGFTDEELERFIAQLRENQPSPADRVARQEAARAAHEELTRYEAEGGDSERQFREVEARMNAAENAFWDAEYGVMGADPTTAAGAVSLLRFVADWIDENLGGDYQHDCCTAGIRAAVDFFEGEA
jgi:hypothetical protein